MAISSRIFLVAFLLVAGLAARPAAAAESYDNCTGFIDSLPATITTQGTWCLRKNLGTNITSGYAIEIAANNVTIDCNHFKVGGLAAGNDSEARGIRAYVYQNVTVRHCNVRGFYYGILLYGAGHLVEDNRLDNNLYMGIYVAGDNNRIQGNAVYDTGGASTSSSSYGISAYANITDNTVSGVFADETGGLVIGISAYGTGAQILGNQVSGLASTAAQGGPAGIIGIWLGHPYQRASNNQVVAGGSDAGSGSGIFAPNGSAFCLDNTVGGFAANIHSNCTGSGNETRP